jgi:hypothetical protein
MFASKFPYDHPRKGDKTFFEDKIMAGLSSCSKQLIEEWGGVLSPKLHTGRKGLHWPDGKLRQVGDEFMPKVWSGRPILQGCQPA